MKEETQELLNKRIRNVYIEMFQVVWRSKCIETDVVWYLEKVATLVDGHSGRTILNDACLNVLGSSCSHPSFLLSQTNTIGILQSTGQSRLARNKADKY